MFGGFLFCCLVFVLVWVVWWGGLRPPPPAPPIFMLSFRFFLFILLFFFLSSLLACLLACLLGAEPRNTAFAGKIYCLLVAVLRSGEQQKNQEKQNQGKGYVMWKLWPHITLNLAKQNNKKPIRTKPGDWLGDVGPEEEQEQTGRGGRTNKGKKRTHMRK